MRDAARRGDANQAMEAVRRVEALSGASLACRHKLGEIDNKIKTLSRQSANFWVIGSQDMPGGRWDWSDPVAVFCCQVIALVRAAASSGSVELVRALAADGVLRENVDSGALRAALTERFGASR